MGLAGQAAAAGGGDALPTRRSSPVPPSWPWTSGGAGAAGEAGARLDDAEVTELLERTEGWPVGLYRASFGRPEEGMEETPAWRSRATAIR